jgi:hypothetical protein
VGTASQFGSLLFCTALVAFLACVGGIALIVACEFGELAVRVTLGVVTAVASLGTLLYWWWFARARRAALDSLAKLPHRIQTYTFTDDQVRVEGSIGDVRYTWDMLEWIKCFSDAWCFCFLNRWHAIPSEQIDEQLAVFLEAKARQWGIRVFRQRFLFLVSGSPRRRTAQHQEIRCGYGAEGMLCLSSALSQQGIFANVKCRHTDETPRSPPGYLQSPLSGP